MSRPSGSNRISNLSMRANLSVDSRGQVMEERSGTNVQPNHMLEGRSMKDQSSVLKRRHPDKQNDDSTFATKRYLDDAINPFSAFSLRHGGSAGPRSRKTMEAYIRAWDVQFGEATRRNEAAERSV